MADHPCSVVCLACVDVCAAVCAGFCLDFTSIRQPFTEKLCSCSCCSCCCRPEDDDLGEREPLISERDPPRSSGAEMPPQPPMQVKGDREGG
ncbi:hypothetical protein B0H11DRAFT_2005464 [Mycena galericulata]|nr:hypothetical protein B0H11DRAFT_2005464 [Mycena galericulata]